MNSIKTREERTQIAINLIKQIKKNEIPDYIPGMKEFRKILNQYLEPDIISGYSGKIRMPELDKILEYNLPMKKNSQPMVRLKNPLS